MSNRIFSAFLVRPTMDCHIRPRWQLKSDDPNQKKPKRWQHIIGLFITSAKFFVPSGQKCVSSRRICLALVPNDQVIRVNLCDSSSWRMIRSSWLPRSWHQQTRTSFSSFQSNLNDWDPPPLFFRVLTRIKHESLARLGSLVVVPNYKSWNTRIENQQLLWKRENKRMAKPGSMQHAVFNHFAVVYDVARFPFPADSTSKSTDTSLLLFSLEKTLKDFF